MNSDITNCPGDGCPMKERCIRFLTPGNESCQSYFFTPPGRKEDGVWSCEMFWGKTNDKEYEEEE